ncbi:MAG: class I SAM-dependent methyltransferase [Chroococcidiopsidaceae cyanobacterium CP_BM_ER_R8_30]|nr:class I SAM-dependent methyltransferase [Chroococcidiopsidaceae cyanobacterium CP_BM_ER_R8_30]
MIEANNPEIDVDKLMQSVLEEVAKRQKNFTPKNINSNFNFNIGTTSVSTINEVDFKNIEYLLNDAEMNAQLPTKFPEKFNRFPFSISKPLQRFGLKLYGFLFKKQRVVNLPLIQAAKDSLTLNRRLIEQVAALQTQVSLMGEHLAATLVQVTDMNDRLVTTDERVAVLDDHLTAIDERVVVLDDHLTATNERIVTIDHHLTATDQRVATIDHHLTATDERAVAIDHHLIATDERVATIDHHLTATDERMKTMDELHLRDDSYLKNDLAQQKRLITLFLEEARQRLPEPFDQEQLQTLVNEESHLLDAFYAAFEEQFRGSRAEIIDRLTAYLPLIEKVKVNTQDLPILDLGCGRGEWLELLHESGYTARGLDINRSMVEQCQARKLEVIEGDAISYLQTLPDASLGVITGFHIVEHLSFTVLIKLLGETVRVLKPGGLSIFETPNPKNLVVGACNFYSDPTHRHPIFPETIQFLLRYIGLSNVEILYLHPAEASPFTQEDMGSQVLHNWFFGARDYAVVGHKL